MEMCVNWTIEGDKPLKKCPQVYELENEIEHVNGLKDLKNKRLTIMHKQLEEAKALHIGHLKDCKERIELLKLTLDAVPPATRPSGKDGQLISLSMQRVYEIVDDFLRQTT